MADKAWKRSERAFAGFFSTLLGAEFRRNDARFNAGDKARNSDVDVEHEKLEIRRDDKAVYKGITGEMKYRSQGFKTLYTWLKKETGAAVQVNRGKTGRFTVIVINKKYIIFWLKDFMFAYDCFVRGLYKNYQIAQYANVIHRESKTQFRELEKAADQNARYGHEKGLFPMSCVRLKGQEQIGVFRIDDIEMIDVTVPIGPELDAVSIIPKAVDKSVRPKREKIPKPAIEPPPELADRYTMPREAQDNLVGAVVGKRTKSKHNKTGTKKQSTVIIHRCFACGKKFESAQALGGHKRHCARDRQVKESK